MAVLNWSDELASGFPVVDAQHQELFGMVNKFVSENSVKTPYHELLKFLDQLEVFCDMHFSYEEGLMKRQDFPLADYHAGLHKDIRRSIVKSRKHIESLEQDRPYDLIVEICESWLCNHISLDDMVFAGFYSNSNYSLDRRFVGRKCELLSADNNLLGTGSISGIEKNEVYVMNNSQRAIPLTMNQMVKVSSVSEQLENQTFLARVFFSTPEIIKLFNATLIQTVNNRERFRVPTKLGASAVANGKTLAVTILDVSADGLMIEAATDMSLGGVITVSFEMRGIKFEEPCEVVRITKGVGSKHTYGIKFKSLSAKSADRISMFVLNEQALARRTNNKA